MKKAHEFEGKDALSAGNAYVSFSQLLEASRGDDIYLSYYSGGTKKSEISFNEYANSVHAWAAWLSEAHSVKQGHRVLVLLGCTPEAYVIYGALLQLGASIVAVDPSETAEYVRRVHQHSEAKLVVALERHEAGANLVQAPVLLVRDGELFKRVFHASSIKTSAFAPVRGEEEVAVFYTSGTTGDPKGVALKMKNVLSNLEGTRRVGRLDENSVLMSCLPLFHVNAFNFSFLLPLFLRCRIVYQEKFFQPAFWRILEQEKVEVASLSPPIIRLLAQDDRKIAVSGSLRYFITASSALARIDLDKIQKKFGVKICQAYGLSETVNFTLFCSPTLNEAEYREVMHTEATPSAGSAVWGNDVFLLAEDGAEINRAHVVGEIAVRGWNVFSGYLKNPSATELSFRGDYFHTGDLAFFKEISGKRFYYIVGRSKETIKRSGKLIYLAEIDQELRNLGIVQACAVGFKNIHTEEEVGLFLVRTERATGKDLLDELRKTLSFAKLPKVVVLGESIPVTAVGKIKRNTLEPAFAKYFDVRFVRESDLISD